MHISVWTSSEPSSRYDLSHGRGRAEWHGGGGKGEGQTSNKPRHCYWMPSSGRNVKYHLRSFGWQVHFNQSAAWTPCLNWVKFILIRFIEPVCIKCLNCIYRFKNTNFGYDCLYEIPLATIALNIFLIVIIENIFLKTTENNCASCAIRTLSLSVNVLYFLPRRQYNIAVPFS